VKCGLHVDPDEEYSYQKASTRRLACSPINILLKSEDMRLIDSEQAEMDRRRQCNGCFKVLKHYETTLAFYWGRNIRYRIVVFIAEKHKQSGLCSDACCIVPGRRRNARTQNETPIFSLKSDAAESTAKWECRRTGMKICLIEIFMQIFPTASG